jgi:hypothetical protein
VRLFKKNFPHTHTIIYIYSVKCYAQTTDSNFQPRKTHCLVRMVRFVAAMLFLSVACGIFPSRDVLDIEIRSLERMNLATSSDVVKNKLCSPHNPACGDVTEQLRRTARLQKIQDIYHNYTAADNYEGTMSTVFALSYVIENIIHPSKICMIGDVETEMVLLVLLYCKHCELAVWRGSPAASAEATYRSLFPDAMIVWLQGTLCNMPDNITICCMINVNKHNY